MTTPTKAPRRTGYGGALLFASAAALIIPLILLAVLPNLQHTASDALSPAPTASAPADDLVPVPTPVPEALHSRWYSQTVPPTLGEGETAWVTVVIRNTGQATWLRGTVAEARLGEVGQQPLPPAMRVDWPLSNRPAIQTEARISPDQLGTFSFAVRGAAPGTFRLQLRPVVDGVAWMEDEGVYVDITVLPRP